MRGIYVGVFSIEWILAARNGVHCVKVSVYVEGVVFGGLGGSWWDSLWRA